MGIVIPFAEEERMLDRKSELCKPVPFSIRALGTIIMMVYVPYVLLKVVFTS